MSVDKFGRHSSTNKKYKENNLTGPQGYGFKLTENNDYDVEGRRIVNIQSIPVEINEAVSKSYADGLFSSLVQQLKEKDVKTVETYTKFCSAIENKLQETRASFKNKMDNMMNIELPGTIEEEVTNKVAQFMSGHSINLFAYKKRIDEIAAQVESEKVSFKTDSDKIHKLLIKLEKGVK